MSSGKKKQKKTVHGIIFITFHLLFIYHLYQPVTLVICWTTRGRVVGGTAAMRMFLTVLLFTFYHPWCSGSPTVQPEGGRGFSSANQSKGQGTGKLSVGNLRCQSTWRSGQKETIACPHLLALMASSFHPSQLTNGPAPSLHSCQQTPVLQDASCSLSLGHAELL